MFDMQYTPGFVMRFLNINNAWRDCVIHVDLSHYGRFVGYGAIVRLSNAKK